MPSSSLPSSIPYGHGFLQWDPSYNYDTGIPFILWVTLCLNAPTELININPNKYFILFYYFFYLY